MSVEPYTLEFSPDFWRLNKEDELKSTLRFGYAFEAIKGDANLHYRADFSQESNLPGTTLGLRYIQGVLVGYQEKSHHWVLGLYVAETADAKPVFRKLIHWPQSSPQTYAESAKVAARALAIILGVALYIYGDKKDPAPNPGQGRTGVTGPLQAHHRQKIEAEAVRAAAAAVKLPVQGPGFHLGGLMTALTLRLSRYDHQGKIEAPHFNLCEIQAKNQVIKLVPPTGLLGAFLGSGGREIPWASIFNLEYRITQAQNIARTEVPTGIKEEISPFHSWGIYLTLKDESLLLLQASYEQSFKLRQAKNEVVGSSKLETNSAEGLRYFQEQLAEENVIENLAKQSEQVALVIAAAMGKPLIKTEISD
jgi:hypothetical protein